MRALRALGGAQAALVVLVSALGYFVDVYDLILFSIVRRSSLLELGVLPDQLLPVGVKLLNAQMVGMLLGGIMWGIWGDKRGRVNVLFGSIILYSLANLANAYVASVDQYLWLRFIAGLGLAGELGAGITLVSETLSQENRGYGTTIVASVGVAGAVAAALIADLFTWRTCYMLGGFMGLALLALRISTHESELFQNIKSENSRGAISLLFASSERFLRYLRCILIGLPIWCAVGILITFSPEIGGALGLSPAPVAGTGIFYLYIGVTIGDFVSGFSSQKFRSRRRAIFVFMIMMLVFALALLSIGGHSLTVFYTLTVLMGFGSGYWAVFVTTAAEQFGTNLRATVATTVPNFVRGAVVPLTLLFDYLRQKLGVVHSAQIVTLACVLCALMALRKLTETYDKHLDFIER